MTDLYRLSLTAWSSWHPTGECSSEQMFGGYLDKEPQQPITGLLYVCSCMGLESPSSVQSLNKVLGTFFFVSKDSVSFGFMSRPHLFVLIKMETSTL